MKQSVRQNIENLLAKDIFLSVSITNRIKKALPTMSIEDLIGLSLILQEGASKQEQILSLVTLQSPSIHVEYQTFLAKQFSQTHDE